MYGMLFVNGERLFALYDTTGHYNPGTMLVEYSLQDPARPVQQNLGSSSLSPYLNFVKHQDNLVFFYDALLDLVILNLNTLETHTLDLEYPVHDIVHTGDFLVVSTYHGLRILDISNLPEYVEVFRDSIYRYEATLALKDTILLDVFLYNNPYQAKIWNITNPENPEVIYEGELPDIQQLRRGSAITDQYAILLDYYSIRRYRHEMYDTLVYEDVLFLDLTTDDLETSDSLIYVFSLGQRIEIVRIDDFDADPLTACEGYWDFQMISFEVFEENIYILVRRRGIYVLQRRAS